MRSFGVVIFLLVASISLSAQNLIDKSIATVKLTKSEQITVKKFESQIDLLEKATKTKLKIDEKKKMLDVMIDDILFSQAAEKELFTVGSAEVEQAMAQKRAQYGFATDDQFKQALVVSGQSWDGYKQLVSNQILKEKYLRAKRPKAYAEPAVTEAEILKVYNAQIGSFAVPPMIQFEQIFVKTVGLKSDEVSGLKTKLDSIAKDVKAKGEPAFRDYYNKALTDKDYFATNGIIVNDPSFSKEYGESFVDAVFKLKKDQISGVLSSSIGLHIILVRSSEDYHLVKIDEVLPGQKITAREQIRQALLSQKRLQAQAEARTDLSAEIRKQADVKIDQKYVWKE